MNSLRSPGALTCAFFLILVAVCVSPVWSVEYFVQQDGPAHVYNAHLMTLLLGGNAEVSSFLSFNSLSIPNASGHWLLAGLLLLVTPFTATKIIATLIFAGFVAAAGWLRYLTVGSDGVKTSMLIGAALGFNWLWLVGTYNFCIGVVIFAAVIGLYWSWREQFTLRRAFLLALLLLAAYFSHLIAFAVLAGSVLVIAFCASKENRFRNMGLTIAAMVPILPLLFLYSQISASGGSFEPTWKSLADPFSIMSWLTHMRTADVFIIISRKTLPFSEAESIIFAIFTPILWILAAFGLLLIASFRGKKEFLERPLIPFALLFVSAFLTALLAPDNFGEKHGTLLRERILLCSLFFFIPLFKTGTSLITKRLSQFCLLFVIVFQTAALMEYSIYSSRTATEFLAAGPSIGDTRSLAAITVVENGKRFHSVPVSSMSNYIGFGRNLTVWDNYEIGYYLVPLVTRNPADKEFIFNYASSKSFVLNDPDINISERIAKLDAAFAEGRIETLIVWGTFPEIDALVKRHFETEPYYKSQNVRLYRKRNYDNSK